jgi:hypothetical protein
VAGSVHRSGPIGVKADHEERRFVEVDQSRTDFAIIEAELRSDPRSARARTDAEGSGADGARCHLLDGDDRDLVVRGVLAGLPMRQRGSLEMSVLTEPLILSGDSSYHGLCS